MSVMVIAAFRAVRVRPAMHLGLRRCRREGVRSQAAQGDRMRTAIAAAVVDQHTLFAGRGDQRLDHLAGARVEPLDPGRRQVAMANLAQPGRVHFGDDADTGLVVCAAPQILQLGLDLGQAIDQRAELSADVLVKHGEPPAAGTCPRRRSPRPSRTQAAGR
ncbi:hypothetical protein D3C77_332120 [compost metagenome]